MRGLVLAANQDPDLQRVFSTWATDNPQVFLNIDREKAQTLGVQVSDIFTALQATLGGYYVNDFNKFGRVWQVQVQGQESSTGRASMTSTASMCATPRATWSLSVPSWSPS